MAINSPKQKVEALPLPLSVATRVFYEKECAELLDLLNEHSVYLVKVKCHPNNPIHETLLFTGFRSGSYWDLYGSGYEHPIPLRSLYSIRVMQYLHTWER